MSTTSLWYVPSVLLSLRYYFGGILTVWCKCNDLVSYEGYWRKLLLIPIYSFLVVVYCGGDGVVLNGILRQISSRLYNVEILVYAYFLNYVYNLIVCA